MTNYFESDFREPADVKLDQPSFLRNSEAPYPPSTTVRRNSRLTHASRPSWISNYPSASRPSSAKPPPLPNGSPSMMSRGFSDQMHPSTLGDVEEHYVEDDIPQNMSHLPTMDPPDWHSNPYEGEEMVLYESTEDVHVGDAPQYDYGYGGESVWEDQVPKSKGKARSFVGGFVKTLRKLPRVMSRSQLKDERSSRKGSSLGFSDQHPRNLTPLPRYDDPGQPIPGPSNVQYVQAMQMPMDYHYKQPLGQYYQQQPSVDPSYDQHYAGGLPYDQPSGNYTYEHPSGALSYVDEEQSVPPEGSSETPYDYAGQTPPPNPTSPYQSPPKQTSPPRQGGLHNGSGPLVSEFGELRSPPAAHLSDQASDEANAATPTQTQYTHTHYTRESPTPQSSIRRPPPAFMDSPVAVTPLPTADYAKMEEPDRRQPPDDSFSAHFTRMQKFFLDLCDLPWLATRVTVDYCPGDSSRARNPKAQPPTWYKDRKHQELDLASAFSPARPQVQERLREETPTRTRLHNAYPAHDTPPRIAWKVSESPVQGAPTHAYAYPVQPISSYPSPQSQNSRNVAGPSHMSELRTPMAPQLVVTTSNGPPQVLLASPASHESTRAPTHVPYSAISPQHSNAADTSMKI